MTKIICNLEACQSSKNIKISFKKELHCVGDGDEIYNTTIDTSSDVNLTELVNKLLECMNDYDNIEIKDITTRTGIDVNTLKVLDMIKDILKTFNEAHSEKFDNTDDILF
ncbi:MAG: hypothetical protein JJV93_01815 [Alphaproteobacteria bacterium]|nr:hypothetical protein [Alphaproteobacteria bacterium]MBL0717984.1 hypothetical protein [Alphaproteobacteria bacterium]